MKSKDKIEMDNQLQNKQEKIDRKVKKLLSAGKNKYFALFDLVIYALLLVFIVGITLFVGYMPKPAGNAFQVYYNNRQIASYSLQKDAEYIFYIEENNAYIEKFDSGKAYKEFNKIQVKGGKVAIIETDCPDKSCQIRGAIDYGELICLPHKLRITIVNVDIDFIT